MYVCVKIEGPLTFYLCVPNSLLELVEGCLCGNISTFTAFCIDVVRPGGYSMYHVGNVRRKWQWGVLDFVERSHHLIHCCYSFCCSKSYAWLNMISLGFGSVTFVCGICSWICGSYITLNLQLLENTVNAELQAVFHRQFEDIFINYLHTKFHVLRHN